MKALMSLVSIATLIGMAAAAQAQAAEQKPDRPPDHVVVVVEKGGVRFTTDLPTDVKMADLNASEAKRAEVAAKVAAQASIGATDPYSQPAETAFYGHWGGWRGYRGGYGGYRGAWYGYQGGYAWGGGYAYAPYYPVYYPSYGYQNYGYNLSFGLGWGYPTAYYGYGGYSCGWCGGGDFYAFNAAWGIPRY